MAKMVRKGDVGANAAIKAKGVKVKVPIKGIPVEVQADDLQVGANAGLGGQMDAAKGDGYIPGAPSEVQEKIQQNQSQGIGPVMGNAAQNIASANTPADSVNKAAQGMTGALNGKANAKAAVAAKGVKVKVPIKGIPVEVQADDLQVGADAGLGGAADAAQNTMESAEMGAAYAKQKGENYMEIPGADQIKTGNANLDAQRAAIEAGEKANAPAIPGAPSEVQDKIREREAQIADEASPNEAHKHIPGAPSEVQDKLSERENDKAKHDRFVAQAMEKFGNASQKVQQQEADYGDYGN